MSESTAFPSSVVPWIVDYADPDCIDWKKSKRGVQSITVWTNGWITEAAPGCHDDECGQMMMPPVGNSREGRCGAEGGHEHPHVWQLNGWMTIAVRRSFRLVDA